MLVFFFFIDFSFAFPSEMCEVERLKRTEINLILIKSYSQITQIQKIKLEYN